MSHLLNVLFITFFVRFWKYVRGKINYISIDLELAGLIEDFIITSFYYGLFELIVWLIM